MTKAFVDSASMHAALSALLIGKDRLAESPWEQQNLLEVTYLLMHTNVHIIPGPPGHYSGPSGSYQQVVARFPQLSEAPPLDLHKAARHTKAWAGRYVDGLRRTFKTLEANAAAQAYCNNQVVCWWHHHVRMYGALFTHDFIPQSALVLNCTEADLLRISNRATDSKVLSQWIRDRGKSDEATLAERAYWLSVLLRGRLHEHLAKGGGLQLVAHPYRRSVQLQLPEGPGKPVLRSEELFARIIIGAALFKRNPEERVLLWAETLRKARDAVSKGSVALPQTVLDTEAELFAVDAARRLGVADHLKILARAIDVTLSLAFPVLVALTVSPWLSPLGPIATQSYRYSAGVSVGDQLARVARSTHAHFRALAKLAPARVERHLRTD